MNISYLITNNSVTLFGSEGPRTLDQSARTFDATLDAIKANDLTQAYELAAPVTTINAAIDGLPGFTLNDGILSYEGQELRGYAVDKLLDLYSRGFPVAPLGHFLVRVNQNPSARAVNELYQFLERGQLPLTPDGKFVAYKRIRENWTDCHTGTIVNKPGVPIPRMPRNQVDDDPTRTCSFGYHVCSMEYLSHFGGARTVAVEVDPADVVSVPIDYDNTKMRVCWYTVVAEIATPEEHNPWNKPVVDDYDEDEDEDEEDEEDEEDYDEDESELGPDLKSFDLDHALAGDSVVTRDGRTVTRIKLVPYPISAYSVLAWLEGEDKDDDKYSFTTEGKYYEDGEPSEYDLFMA